MESRSIVVGTDGSRAANETVKHGAAVARMMNATLHIVSAYREPSAARKRYEMKHLPDNLDIECPCDAQAAAKAIAEDAAYSVRHRGIRIKLHVVHGDPAAALCEVAERVRAARILVGNKGARHPLRPVYRPIFARVQRRAACEVWVLDTERFRRPAATTA